MVGSCIVKSSINSYEFCQNEASFLTTLLYYMNIFNIEGYFFRNASTFILMIRD